MGMTVESYQRFESQKMVGRHYPWLAPHQVQTRSTTFRRTLSAPGDIFTRDPAAVDTKKEYLNFCKSMNVDSNNLDEKEDKPLKDIKFIGNITDDDKLSSTKHHIPDETDTSWVSTSQQNVPDDDLMDNIEEIKEYLRKTSADLDSDSPVLLRSNFEENIDRVPSLPPPPRPTSTKHPYLEKLHRLSTFKDMLVFNAENFIKERVPRIPEGMFEHHGNEKEIKKEAAMKPMSAQDETDILLPTRKKVVDGIESDDIVAKFISFLGWVMFLLMRMISLSVFAVFYPEICGYICLAHYIFMLLCLINETRFKEKWQRTGFYLILSYIYIFNLLEFKIKFKSVRTWYIGYFLIVMTQNIVMTIVWYKFTVFLYSWWFEFMFIVILQSGIMSLMCLILYFFYLKPKDKVFFVNE